MQRWLMIVVVVLLAAAALLDVTGVVPGAGMLAIPFLVLLAAALYMVRTIRSPREATAAADLYVPLEDASTAQLDLKFGAGELALTADAPDGVLLAGHLIGAAQPRVQRQDSTAAIRLRQPFSLGRRHAHWRLALSPAVRWQEVRLAVGAADVQLALSALEVGALVLESGASTLTATLPRAGEVLLEMSGGRVTLRIPADAAAVVTNRIKLGEVIIDEAHFAPDAARVHWTTPGVTDAPLHVTLSGGLGTVEVVRAD